MPAIGIKIANGEFYSILEENSKVKKRLILTTAHDDQKSIQIDLYRSFMRSMLDAQYIGSLVIEEFKPEPKGVPSVELIIASNSKGILTADAVNLDTSGGREPHHLSVALTSFDEDDRDIIIADYELENFGGPPSALYEQGRKRRFPLILVSILGGVLIFGIVLWLLLTQRLPFGPGAGEIAPVEQAPLIEQAAPVIKAPLIEQAAPVVIEQAPPAPVPTEPTPPVAAEQAPPVEQTSPAPVKQAVPVRNDRGPAAIPREGLPYRIRWGDTLWDISEAFYRNPWLYTRIARFNGIRNPNRIIAGTTIRIPPQN